MADLDSTELHIRDTPQYFFDTGMIEEIQNITRTVHSPVMFEGNPVIKKDRPWEHHVNMHADDYQVWRSDDGRFHCLYSDFDIDREKAIREGGTFIDADNSRFRVCYARSEDGVTWTKPPMGIAHVDGHDTNIVMGDATHGNVWGLTILDDPLETDPAQRYKSIYEIGPPGFRVADELPGANVRRAYSADGIHWTTYDEPPVFEGLGAKQGDGIYPFFDPSTRTYCVITRHPWMEMAPRPRVGLVEQALAGGSTTDAAHGLSNRRGMRRIFFAQSRDFLHWSDPRLVLAPDTEMDNFDDSFYSMRPYRLGSHWVGFLGVLNMTTRTLFPQLAHSRDARKWDRLQPTHPWIGSGGKGSFYEFTVAAPHMVDVGDETWLYFGGIGGSSTEDRGPYALGLGKLRRHGFVSVGTNDLHEGMLLTEAFIAPGDRLVINAACGPQGFIKVEAADVTYAVMPGRSADDCDVFTGDSISHVVTWGGDPTLPLPEGTDSGTVYPKFIPHRHLRFYMHDAELYSFQIVSSSD